MTSDTVLSVDGTTIVFNVEGSDFGPVLLRVDGAAATHQAMNPGRAEFTRPLADRFRVVSYDRRGRGGSGDRDAYAVECEVEDVAALLDRFGGRGFFVGLVSRAALALRCAAAGLPIDGLACYEPSFVVSPGRAPVAIDYVERLRTEIDSGRQGAAMKLFMTEDVGMPNALVDGMADQPLWPGSDLAPTLVYDAHVMDESVQG